MGNQILIHCEHCGLIIETDKAIQTDTGNYCSEECTVGLFEYYKKEETND